MPVVVLHVSQELSQGQRQALAAEVRQATVAALDLPPEFGKVILYASPPVQRSVHPSRDPGFVLAEVHFFRGRGQEIKARLFAALDQAIRRHTGLSPENVFIHLLESPRHNWGLRGGRPADEVELP
ncbi:MAG: tautomerase family protein [Thermodesulfobacteriota bacterium]